MLLPPLTPTFEAALRDVHAKNLRFRVDAARRLGDLSAHDDRTAALDGTRTLLADAHPSVRAEAVRTLGRIGTVDDHARLRSALDDDHPEVRTAALSTLDRLCPEGALPEARVALANDCAALRAEAVAILASSDRETDRERLHAHLDDADETVRAFVAIALAHRGDTSTREVLVGLLRSPFAFEAARALLQVRVGPHAEAVRPSMNGFFASPYLRITIATLLALEGDARAVERLRRHLLGPFSLARGYALECIGEYQITALRADVRTLERRPRGLPLDAIREAMARLDEPLPPRPHST